MTFVDIEESDNTGFGGHGGVLKAREDDVYKPDKDRGCCGACALSKSK